MELNDDKLNIKKLNKVLSKSHENKNLYVHLGITGSSENVTASIHQKRFASNSCEAMCMDVD